MKYEFRSVELTPKAAEDVFRIHPVNPRDRRLNWGSRISIRPGCIGQPVILSMGILQPTAVVSAGYSVRR